MRNSAVVHGQDRPDAVDPAGLAEALISPLLSLVCANADVRRRLGLKGASRRADGWPAWYFWFAGVSGAHELAFVPPADGEDAPRPLEFAIRYFPHLDEDAFATFAPIEQATRRSGLFDGTGTPAVEAFDAIDPSLFHVATLAIAPSSDLIDLEFTAQDCWVESEAVGESSRLRRSVHGFELGAPVLDLMVGAHAYHGRRPPRGVEVLCEPGLRWHVNGDAGAACAVAADLSLLTVHVRGLRRFGAEGRDDPAAEDLPPLLRPRWQASVLRHYGRAAPPRFAGLDLETWWRAAAWRFIPSGLFCGCQAEDLSVAGRDEADACVAAGGRLRASP
jgi:hypothetical protein